MESDRQYELRLTAEPQRFTVVRRIIAAHLRHWNLPDLVDQALLGVTELLGNVHRHVGPTAECLLRLSAADGCLRCEVHDESPALPRLLDPPEDEPNGRGLALVAALSKEWGARPAESGKVVWFSLQISPVPAEVPTLVAPDRPTAPLRLAPLPVPWTTPATPSLDETPLEPLEPPEQADERGRVPVRARA